MNETSDAMSAVHFRWRWGKIAKHITSVFRSVRPIHRSPSTSLDVNKGTSSCSAQNKRDKGKWKATEPSKPPKDADSKATKGLRSKSIENRSRGTAITPAPSQNSFVKTYWGSNSNNNVLGREVSASTSKSGSEKRSRFLFWRPTIFQSTTRPSSPQTRSPAPQSLGPVSGANPKSRRSEEALRFFRPTQSNDDESGRLTAARRASSWGQGDRELHEVVSLTSIERELNDHDMNVGAGGVSRDGDFGIGVAGPSLFDSILGPSGPSLPEETFEGRYARKPIYDEDSSTFASRADDDDDDEWQHGSMFDEEEEYDIEGEEEDGDEEDEDAAQENGVIFSPRRRPSDTQ